MQRITKADGNVVCFVNSTSQMETCSMCILLWLLLIIKLEHLWTTSPGFCKISWESCNLAIPHPYFEAATASVSDYTDYRVIHGGAFVFSGVFSSSFSLLLFFMVPHFHWIIQPSCVDLSAVMGTETEGTEAPVCLSSIPLPSSCHALSVFSFSLAPSQSQDSINRLTIKH